MDLSSPAENERHMPEEVKQEWRRRHRGNFLIPAGVLIGLGVGLLYGQPGPGVLIGLGLGFVGSAFLSSMAPSQEAPAPLYGPRWISVIIGVFIILLGLSIVWGPPIPWTSVIALLLILLGIGFVARGLGRMR